jgi:SAM-dependent methyltransferase
MKECSKSIARRLADSNFTRKYFNGKGIDIGGKPDPLSLYTELFCRIESVKIWDIEDGDAQFLKGIDNYFYDFAHSSHCLEHMQDPYEAIKNWFRVVKKNGYLIVTVPDEDLYEQGIFPSNFNRDHKWTFTIYKKKSWSNKSVNIIDLISSLDESAELVRIEQLNNTYRFDLPRYDQTITPVAECGIEFIIKKRPDNEVMDHGAWRKINVKTHRDLLIHLNQYKDDINSMKISNQNNPPFLNDNNIES